MVIHDLPRRAQSPPGRARVVALQSVQARLIEAARSLVAEQGWQGAQVALIAARAGVATGSVYRHFHSKADLFAHVLADVSAREIANVERITAGRGPAERRLHQAVTSFMQRALAGRRLAYALIAEPCEPGDRSRAARTPRRAGRSVSAARRGRGRGPPLPRRVARHRGVVRRRRDDGSAGRSVGAAGGAGV